MSRAADAWAEETTYLRLLWMLEDAWLRGGPERARIGGGHNAEDEPVHIGGRTSNAFPTRDVHSIRTRSRADGSLQPALHVLCLTLNGPDSPMPASFATEYCRLDEEDVLRTEAYLDIFHHRLHSLMYRSWARYRPGVDPNDQPGSVAEALYALVGSSASGAGRPAGAGGAALYLQFPRSADTLARALRAAFRGVPFDIEQCVLRKARLSSDQTCGLGLRRTSLGLDMVLGDTVLDGGNQFRVCVGPADAGVVDRFERNGADWAALHQIVHHWTEPGMRWDVELILLQREAMPMQLGRTLGSGRLGTDAWLGSAGRTSPSTIIDSDPEGV